MAIHRIDKTLEAHYDEETEEIIMDLVECACGREIPGDQIETHFLRVQQVQPRVETT